MLSMDGGVILTLRDSSSCEDTPLHDEWRRHGYGEGLFNYGESRLEEQSIVQLKSIYIQKMFAGTQF